MNSRIIFSLMLFFLVACNQGSNNQVDENGSAGNAGDMAVSDSVEKQIAALSDGDFVNRKFVRTSALTFKVDNVQTATTAIQKIVREAAGFIVYSKMNSQINQRAVTELSRDSALESVQYTVQNLLTIRVPTTQFDTVLSKILPLANFLDDQTIELDDVSFQVLSNNMTIRRAVSGSKKKQKESNLSNAYQQEEADRAKVDNLSLNDRMKYSDIRLSFSQRSLVKQTVIPNENHAMEYHPGFGNQLRAAFIDGWLLVEWLFLTIIKSWSMILVGLTIWFLYRKYKQ